MKEKETPKRLWETTHTDWGKPWVKVTTATIEQRQQMHRDHVVTMGLYGELRGVVVDSLVLGA